jgi:hypothetical protein
MNDAKEPHTAASAIAAFDATQLAFVALVKKGALSKIEAEEILRQAIKTASTGDQAAELLAGILEDFPSLSPHLGNRATKNTCAAWHAAGRSLVRHRSGAPS